MKNYLFTLYLIGLVMFSSTCLAASEMYVKSLKAKVLTKISSKGSVVETLIRGDKVNIIQKKGFWFEVKTEAGKKGWLSKFMLSKDIPRKESKFMDKNVDLGKKARRKASLFTTTAAGRGFTNNKDISFDNKENKLQSIEKRYVVPKKGQKFLDGK